MLACPFYREGNSLSINNCSKAYSLEVAELGSLVYTLRPYRPWPQGREHWLLVWSDGEKEHKAFPGITIKCATLLINDLGYLSSQKDNYFFLDIQGHVHQHIHTRMYTHTQPHSVFSNTKPPGYGSFSLWELFSQDSPHSLPSSQPSSQGQKHKQLGLNTVSSQWEGTDSQPLSLAQKHWRTDIS